MQVDRFVAGLVNDLGRWAFAVAGVSLHLEYLREFHEPEPIRPRSDGSIQGTGVAAGG